MNKLCKLFGHKYKYTYDVYGEKLRKKCVRCGDKPDGYIK